MDIDRTNENYYHSCMEPPAKPCPGAQTQRVPQPDSCSHPRCVASEQLLGAAGELLIMHAGRQYRLRLTQNGKLILTA